MSIPEPTPRELAVWALRTAIREAARDVHGATTVQVAIVGMPSIKRDALDAPLAGVGAALLARDVANAELRTYAEEARGAGCSRTTLGRPSGSRRQPMTPRATSSRTGSSSRAPSRRRTSRPGAGGR